MTEVLDAEKLEKNFNSFIKSHNKAIDILKKADGKKDYKEIAKETKLNEKTVSPLLKKAERLGLAKRVKPGIYKKQPGILGFAPSRTFGKQEVRFKKSFKTKIKKAKSTLEEDAWKNAEVYPFIFILENTLRKLILQQLGNDIAWWKKPFVAKEIIAYAESIKKQEEETPWIKQRGDHPIYYVTLKHLSKIIQINWNKFSKLGEQNTFLTRLKDLFPIRNSLAHNIPLTSRDRKEVDIAVDKIVKIIKSKYKI